MSILHSVLNVEVLVGAFNLMKALVGAFTVIVKPSRRFVASSMSTTDTGEERTGRGIKHNSLAHKLRAGDRSG